VGVGASAGGLVALQALLGQLGMAPGMAIVIVQHLDPSHESLLSEILSRATSLPVAQGVHGMTVRQDAIYVVPPNRRITIAEGTLQLAPRTNEGRHLPIDDFLRSLASERGSQAIAVILSGTGSDGAEGVRAVKAEGGLTFAQDEGSAEFPEMPRNSVATGAVDFVLPPDEIAKELNRIGHHPFSLASTAPSTVTLGSRDQEAFIRILGVLRKKTGVDFVHYKHQTLKRRVLRRMALAHLDRMTDYAALLMKDGREAAALAQDALIKATSFFRDPLAFETLSKRVFPALLRRHGDVGAVRIWVVGCSTGEEAYSIAICATEVLGRLRRPPRVQIFCTDVDGVAIEKARLAEYPLSIERDVSAARLRRFFVRTGTGYKVAHSIRELCVFARHDVLKDPPFSRMDLVSCRNVLIYLGATLQQRALGVFQYALEKGGFLLLGNAERVGAADQLFRLVDAKVRLHVKKVVPNVLGSLGLGPDMKETPPRARDATPPGGEDGTLLREVARRLILRPAANCLVVDGDMDVVFSQGDVGPFVTPIKDGAGERSGDAARVGLVESLRTAVRKATKSRRSSTSGTVSIRRSGKARNVAFEVAPLHLGLGAPPSYLVMLAPRESSGDAHSAAGRSRRKGSGRPSSLARIRANPARLRSFLEEYDVTNEELMSANEEIQSSNEELQSTNEELETAREEMQSSNEELTTLNDELKVRNSELQTLNGDLSTLLESVDLPLLMLGSHLEIRRMTPAAASLLRLAPSDIGRRLPDLHYEFAIPSLERIVRAVTEQVMPQEVLVADSDGHTRVARVRPSHGPDHRVDGVIVTWTPVGGFNDRAQGPREVSRALLEASAQPRAIVDGGLRVEVANAAWLSLFGAPVQPGVPLGCDDEAPWIDATLRAELRAVASGGEPLSGRIFGLPSRTGDTRRFVLSAQRLPWESSDDFRILVTLHDAKRESTN
jgi:two-component system CheB/CheR fusion protein